MSTLGNYLQTGDWKGEKHVPVIHAPDKVKAGEGFELKLSIGDAIKHPTQYTGTPHCMDESILSGGWQQIPP